MFHTVLTTDSTVLTSGAMVLQEVRVWFWNPELWLPANVTWADLAPSESNRYPNHREMMYLSLPVAFAILILRWFLEKYCFAPLGVYFGICRQRRKVESPEPELERLYRMNPRTSQRSITAAAAQISMPEKQVARWFRIRRMRDRPSKLAKFCESSFRFTYYFFSFTFGLWVIWGSPWMWDIQACWESYPYQSVDPNLRFFFITALSFYISATVSHFFDVKRKDSLQMFIHHILTLSLMSLCWVTNIARIGSLTFVIHDCADIFLESGKLALYCKRQRLADGIFLAFIAVWVTTRLGLFPFWIIRNMLRTRDVVGVIPYYSVNFMLVILFLIHLFWTYLIFKLAYKSILHGKLEQDNRSSSELSESDPDDPATVTYHQPTLVSKGLKGS